MEMAMIMGKDTSGTRRPRRKPGEPRTCAEPGCGLVLTEENSYKGSYYCKPHHQAKTLASRDREANIERVKRYNAAHPEVVKRNKEKSAERRAQGLPPHPTRGRPRKKSED